MHQAAAHCVRLLVDPSGWLLQVECNAMQRRANGNSVMSRVCVARLGGGVEGQGKALRILEAKARAPNGRSLRQIAKGW
jgi:hypothetical protein